PEPEPEPVTEPTAPIIPELPEVARDVALQTALAGVEATLDAVAAASPDSARAVDGLYESWVPIRDSIEVGDNANEALSQFRREVDEVRRDGGLNRVEAEAIKLSLRAVRAAL
ncbi:MAG: hypothetical protein Q4F65_07790, partial [Propionibacteriaceae bacterium]|nr:hypothetical protein [Propionibacteriaceae bacterium]